MQILNRDTNEVIYENKEITTIKLLVEEAVKLGISLRDANLVDANLRSANLRYANLEGANLIYANLLDANLEGANLRYANLEGANLRSANLRYANLEGANLIYANLLDANLENANLPDFLVVPETGSFFAYKKLEYNVVVKIEIPENAKRTNSLVSRKCRTNEFTIVEVIDNPNNVKLDINNRLQSTNYKSDGYYLGGTFKEPNYNDDIRLECTEGLHFFSTLKEARNWQLIKT